jgi:hypothetical protein
VCYPDKSNPAGEASQNLTVTPTPVRRKHGGQKGNRNACKHGFYSATLSPAETSQLWNITNLEGVDPEIALIRVKLQSSLQHDPANRRVIREASRLLVKWYSANYRLDPTDRNYLKTVVESLLEIASMRQSASPRLAKINGNPTKRIVRVLTTKSAAGSHLTYEKDLLNSRKNSHFCKTNHPRKGNNGGPGGLMEDPISIQITTFFAHMPRTTLLSVSRSFYLPVTKSEVRYSSLAGVTQW